jgi:hypothetical protein
MPSTPEISGSSEVFSTRAPIAAAMEESFMGRGY